MTVEHPDPDGDGFGMSDTLCIAWELDLAEALKAIEAKRVRGLVAMMPGWASPTGQWSSRQVTEVWLEADDNGKFVTLMDDSGKVFDGAMRSEPSKSRGASELLLRLPPFKSGPTRARSGNAGTSRRRAASKA
ncbi:hypothetical protein [Roseateles hydrophilus]|nr:hypothetical protein [Pelomonas sp. UHG3]